MIISAIKKIITTVCRAFYAVIALFNLQFTLFVAVVGLLLYLTGVLTDNEIVKTMVIVAGALSIVYAVISTVCKLFGFGKKRTHRQKNEKVVVQNEEQERQTETRVTIDDEPKYFKVKQNPNLVMAEYDDRYELFEVVGGQMKKIRTDYK